MMMNLHVPSSVDGALSSAYLTEVRGKLWRALRAPSPDQLDGAEDAQAGGQTEDPSSSDVHNTGPTSQGVVPLELTSSAMAHLISCVFCSVHTNATAEDADEAAATVLKQLRPDGDGDGDDGAVATYTQADVDGFLDSIPSRWLPDLVTALEEAARASVPAGSTVWEDFNVELIDCIVSDVAPYGLLSPLEVLTLQRTVSAVELEAPLTNYLTVRPTRTYPPIYDTLFEKLRLDDRSAAGLSISQFRLFFNWFYALHFRNTNLARAGAAADNVYHRYRDRRGDLTVTQFQLACEEVCAVYAQRRDAAAYLRQLVQRTDAALAEERLRKADGAVSAEFFLHPEQVTVPAWRRDLVDPTQLYLPDELRVLQQEAERHHRHTSPRILLTGPQCIGKSDVGRALAAALHCVHLDVLDLALAAVQTVSGTERRDDDSAGAVVAACLQSHSPIPLETQVALLRRAMLSERVQHRGYVFSDTITGITSTTIASNSGADEAMAALEDHFVNALRLFEEARPSHVVELVAAVPEVYEEVAASRAAAVSDACAAAWAAVSSSEEKARQAAEKKQMKADCERILSHLVELEGAAAGAVSAEELDVARQQAVEAQEILDALNAETNEAEEGDKESAAFGDGEEATTTPEAVAEREAQEARLRLAALLYDGRVAAGVQVAAGLVPLDAQDWTTCWRRSIEFAKSLGHYVSVDAIASESTGDVVSYITHAFDLHPCDLAEAILAPGEQPDAFGDAAAAGGSERDDVGSAATGDARATASTLAEDEDRGSLVEGIIQERGLRPSPVWKRLCPVTASVDGVLVEGAACFTAAYRGCYYHFASARKRHAFVENPTRYLAHAFPEQKAVLLLADDALLESAPQLLQQIAEEMSTQLRLTPYAASTYARLLEPRQALLRARRTAQSSRQTKEVALRKARHERQEQAARAQAKKPKGKLEPTKPKAKRLSDSAGRAPSLQSSQQQLHKGSVGGGRRRVPRAMVVEGPQTMADEKQLLIDAAKERLSGGAPVLVTATAVGDLQVSVLQTLLEQQLIPETVIVLSNARATTHDAPTRERAAHSGVAEDAEAEDEEAEESEENKNTTATAAAAAAAATNTAASSQLSQILQLLKKSQKGDWRSPKKDSGERVGGTAAAPSLELHSVSLSDATTAAEVLAEVLQFVNPLTVRASDDAVDEALGEEDEEGGVDAVEDEEAEEDDAIIYPDGANRPISIARAPRDPLVKPTRRFLHQFGSRLDFCPVALHDRGILVRGKQEFCLRYADGLYIFASEEARDAFARCPQRYVGELPPQDVPPRVWLVGATQSGKKTLASGLQEAYRVPYFVYDRQFFEECVEAALTPGGAMVRGVYIPPDTKEANPYLKRAFTLLESVHDRDKEEKKALQEKAEAERQLEEHERKVEEREAREEAGEGDDEEEEDDWTEEKEQALQAKLDFEPEDEEEKQVRLSEAYLRIASCVTRFKPFDRLGYVMVCPPFSDGDLDVLFDEGGIPEVVVRLNMDEDVFNQRSALHAAARRAAAKRAKALNVVARERAAARQATQASREAARAQRAREKALAKWRRRHIGANDVDVPSDGEEAVEGNERDEDSGEPKTSDNADDDDDDAVEAEADRQAQEDALEEFVTFVEERRVEVVKINAAAAKETVRRAVVEALGRHLRYRASLFYHPEVLRPEEAEAQLAAGLCDWSSFGTKDPVQLYAYRHEGQRTACVWKPAGVRVGPEDTDEADVEGSGAESDNGGEAEQPPEEPEEMSEVASDEVEELRNAVNRRDQRARRETARRVARVHHRLYAFANDATLLRFMRNPWPFMREAPPYPTLPEAPVVALYEPDTRFETEVDGTKQRCLADSVAFNLRTKCVSASSLLAWGAVHAHWQALRLDCMLAAQRGAVDAQLTQKLLTLYLSSAAVKRSGAVLHNIPITADSANALARVSCAAPVVKVMTALPTDSGAGDAEAAPASSSSPSSCLPAAAQAMAASASVMLTLPHPRVPLDSSNLVTAVHGVETFAAQAAEAMLRESRAFPIALRDTYQVFRHVQRHLSEFGCFCPYEWVEKGDLVQSFPSTAPITDLSCGAKYLGQYYFFSSSAYLQRFLADPTTVADTVAAKPLPKHLPTAVSPAAAAGLPESALALEGCCPVLLYDTRDRRGMRGVRQPLAKKGALDCVVEYDGQKYAMLNSDHRDRFLRRPWQYAQEAQLPAVLRRPLPKGVKPSSLTDAEEYMQRQLYDPVAQALLAVGRERPIYPGLSAEESALKYVALYLKAHRDPSTVSSFEAESYKSNFELYQRRSTLYRQVISPQRKAGAAAAGASRLIAAADVHSSTLADGDQASEDFCTSYEESHADADNLTDFNRLPDPAQRAWN